MPMLKGRCDGQTAMGALGDGGKQKNTTDKKLPPRRPMNEGRPSQREIIAPRDDHAAVLANLTALIGPLLFCFWLDIDIDIDI